MNPSLRIAVATIAFVPALSFPATSESFDWKSECIGRMQLSLPGNAEVGARTASSWQAERKNSNVPMRFEDETLAGWSRQTRFWVTHALPPAELESLYGGDVWTVASFALKVKQYPHFSFDRSSFRTYPVAPLNGTAWSYGVKNLSYMHTQEMVVRMGDHLVRWHDRATDAAGQLRVQQDFERTKRNISLRPLYSVPDRPGICYPYLFLQDDDGEPWRRGVNATYRLKDHPDITIWLSDANATGRVQNETSRHQGARYNAEFFWRTDYQKYDILTYLFSMPTRFPATRMAGYPGVESYVKLEREDGTVDYGYLVSVRGDPDAQQDEPDLMLYVIRDAAEARARGVEPYGDEKSFLALARSIAATVKRRPVVAGPGR